MSKPTLGGVFDLKLIAPDICLESQEPGARSQKSGEKTFILCCEGSSWGVLHRLTQADTAIPPWVELSQDGMGVLLGCYHDISSSTTIDRCDGKLNPLLVTTKWRKR
jgi:hypothetical protein